MSANPSKWSNTLKQFVANLVHTRYIPVYLCLSIITTPLPFSCFKITMSSLFDSLDTISLYLYGKVTLQYISHVLLSLVLILLSSFSGMFDMSLERFWKYCSNSVKIAFLLILVGISWSYPYANAVIFLLLKRTIKLCTIRFIKDGLLFS